MRTSRARLSGLVTGAVLPALLVMPIAARAQTITGVVVEDSTRTPIPAAYVALVTEDGRVAATAHSGEKGDFVLLPRRSGEFLLRVSHPSYVELDSLLLTVEPGAALVLEVRLGRAATPLEPLLVTVRSDTRAAGFYERTANATFGTFITRADIDARGGISNATDILRGIASIELQPHRSTFTMATQPAVYYVTMQAPANRCMPAILVDGLEVQQPIDDFLTADMIEGAEVYPRSTGAPTEWGAENACGIVAFWTREFEGDDEWSWKRLGAGAGALGIMSLIVLLVR